MNRLKTIILAALIMSAATAICVALETDIKTVTTQTFEVDLGPEFAIDQDFIQQTSEGAVKENLTVFNKKHPLKQKADLLLIMLYGRDVNDADPSFMALLLDSIGLEYMISSGWSENGNWTTTSKKGIDVRIHFLSRNGQDMDFASWQIGDGIYASMNSILDNNTTERIVNTASIK